MNEDSNRNKLILPLSPILINYIKHEYKDIGAIIISTVELTVKESRNHYHNMMKALEPLLSEKTKTFVDKLFMFRKKMCREGIRCTSEYCLFAHDESEIPVQKRSVADYNIIKKLKTENNEVVFNRVDETKYSMDDLSTYSKNFGTVNSIRRLNRGKYLVIFNSPDESRKLIESTDYVFGDSDIKKFYNVNIPSHNSYSNPVQTHSTICSKVVSASPPLSNNFIEISNDSEIFKLLEEQKNLINKIEISFKEEIFLDLKAVTKKIRTLLLKNIVEEENNELNKEDTSSRKADVSDIESSIYYNMFAD